MNFAGTVPSSLGRLTNLQMIDLSSNSFSGTIPSEVGNLRLNFMDFGRNSFSGPLPSTLYQLTNFTALYLTRTNVNGSIANEIGQLTKLIRYRMYRNQMSGTFPSQVGNLAIITLFDISFNHKITGEFCFSHAVDSYLYFTCFMSS